MICLANVNYAFHNLILPPPSEETQDLLFSKIENLINARQSLLGRLELNDLADESFNHEHSLRRVFKLMLSRWRSQPIKYRVRERRPITERLQSISLKSRLSDALKSLSRRYTAGGHWIQSALYCIFPILCK